MSGRDRTRDRRRDGRRPADIRQEAARNAATGKAAAGPDREVREQAALSRRTLVLGLGQLAVLGGLGARLHQLQVVEAARYAPLADDNRINTLALAPTRGRIFDRTGELLADNAQAFRVTAVPALVDDLQGALERLAQVIPLGADERALVLARAKRQPPTMPIVVTSEVSFEQVAQINQFAPELPGIDTETYGRRQYFHVGTVGHIVGGVGAVERVGLGDDPVLRIPGMRIGRSGVERGMETTLRGVGGALRREVDARGRIVRDLMRFEQQPGADIVLSVDLPLQRRVLQRLQAERRAAAVALDVATGEVVAMASVPSFDPEQAIASRAGAPAPRLVHQGDDPLVNRVTSGLYPPGSTFKIVTALAALEAGVLDPRERIECSGSYEYFDHTYRCWKRSGHGRCDLHRAIRESCDCFHYEIARRLGIDRIAAMANLLGLGQSFPAGIAPQSRGVVPTPSWKRGRYGRGWLGGDTLLVGIGQGFVLATPLQLAVMTARVATGRMVMPTVVRPDARGRTGTGAQSQTPFAPLGVREASLDAVRRALRAVVNEEGGTGVHASMGDVGPEVAGKTGTSQVSRRSADRDVDNLKWEERDHALFVGYFPANAPRYAVATVLEHAGGGGAAAAPVVRDIMLELVARDPARLPAYDGHAKEPRQPSAAAPSGAPAWDASSTVSKAG